MFTVGSVKRVKVWYRGKRCKDVKKLQKLIDDQGDLEGKSADFNTIIIKKTESKCK